jgi:hypothetical protein
MSIRLKGTFTAGERVEVLDIPWRHVIATYIGKERGWIRMYHKVQLGDLVSGGTPRVVQVRKVKPAPQVIAGVNPCGSAGTHYYHMVIAEKHDDGTTHVCNWDCERPGGHNWYGDGAKGRPFVL